MYFTGNNIFILPEINQILSSKYNTQEAYSNVSLSTWYKGKNTVCFNLIWVIKMEYFTENKAGDISEGTLTRVTFPKSHNPNP